MRLILGKEKLKTKQERQEKKPPRKKKNVKKNLKRKCRTGPNKKAEQCAHDKKALEPDMPEPIWKEGSTLERAQLKIER